MTAMSWAGVSSPALTAMGRARMAPSLMTAMTCACVAPSLMTALRGTCHGGRSTQPPTNAHYDQYLQNPSHGSLLLQFCRFGHRLREANQNVLRHSLLLSASRWQKQACRCSCLGLNALGVDYGRHASAFCLIFCLIYWGQPAV
jgi:hypothetical protein